ncbi:MAG: nucleotidyl transferase AbiEii/AbiGii toxin family protein [Akkermansiaceae bacterium]|nr:nucleotidyl transferase AbiEii/AbiGii toxin family protein [Akkermansiaceae bacterium]
MKHEGLIESIRQRLLNLARANGEAFDFVLARYGVERFLYRLGRSELADRFVLKGAMLFHVWNQKLHRPTRDVDLLGTGKDDPESVRELVLAIMRVECPEDGLTFDGDSLAVGSIRDEMSYGGVRAKFRATLGNVRIPIQVDVGFGDAVTPAPQTLVFPVLLPGMPDVSLKTYPVCTVIAEKFEALVRLDAQNSRMKDFFDLDYLLSSGGAPDRRQLEEAIHATFRRRGTQIPAELPTGLTDTFSNDRRVMWNAFLHKNGLVSGDLAQVTGRIRSALEWVWKT